LVCRFLLSRKMDSETLVAAALAAFQATMPGENVATMETITHGWDSLALLVNRRWLLRVARRPEVSVTLAREARLLPLIGAAVAPVSVPQFVFTRFDAEPAVVGYEAIAGKALTNGDVTPAAHAAAIADQLASFLTALHSIPAERAVAAGMPSTTAVNWYAEYVAFAEWTETEVGPRLAPHVRDGVMRRWTEYLDAPDSRNFEPVLIHHDLACEHILLAKDRALAGVIDWGDATLGDPAIDFTGILAELGETFTSGVISRWRGPRAASETTATLLGRAEFYHRLVPLHAIRFGMATGADAYIQRGLAELELAVKKA
jgi:aminoglycoside 2''-phosphotransferase